MIADGHERLKKLKKNLYEYINKVTVDKDGNRVSPYSFDGEIFAVFITKDGYALACPEGLTDVVRKKHPTEWVIVYYPKTDTHYEC